MLFAIDFISLYTNIPVKNIKLNTKFENFLTDSLELKRFIETNKFDKNGMLFTIDFKSLYTNVPVKDTISSIKELCSNSKWLNFWI